MQFNFKYYYHEKVTNNPWDAGVIQEMKLNYANKDLDYIFSFEIRSDADRSLVIMMEDYNNGYVKYGISSDPESTGKSYWTIDHVSTTPTVYTFHVNFKDMAVNCSQHLIFAVGASTAILHVDNVSLMTIADYESYNSGVPENQIPLANAGADQSINEGATVTLNGSASSDADGDVITYKWTVPEGIILSSETEANPTFVAPEVSNDTPLTFSLVVNDGQADSPADAVVISVLNSVQNQEQTFEKQIVASSDDAEESKSTGICSTGSSDIELDQDLDSGPQWAALRFTELSIPKNATIVEAHIQFTSKEASDPTNPNCTIAFAIENSDNAATFIDGTNTAAPLYQLSGRSMSESKISWSVPEWSASNEAGPAELTPDLKSLVQTVVNRAGWTSGNAVCFIFDGPGTGWRNSRSFDGNNAQSAVLKVTYIVGQANIAPLANAGIDQTVNEGTIVSLDGSASSDADGNVLTYKWTAPAGIILSSETDAKPTFTSPEVTADTQYTFSLVVNDGQADSPADEVVFNVLNVDKAPYVKNQIEDISVDKGSPNQIIDLKTVFADDDLTDVLSYSVSSNSNDQVVQTQITGTDLTISFSTQNIGTSEIVVTVSSNGKVATSTFNVVVKIPMGIDPLTDNAEVQIYPNPAKELVQVKFNQTPEAGTWITIYNITGNIIYKSLAVNKIEYLNLKGNHAGLYFIKVNQKTPKTYKLILE